MKMNYSTHWYNMREQSVNCSIKNLNEILITDKTVFKGTNAEDFHNT